MSKENMFERLSEIQNEILAFTMEQVGDKVEKFYVQGKVTDDEFGSITGVQGNLRMVVVKSQVFDVSQVLDDASFKENVAFIRPRIMELHSVLRELQGRSPVRFRWVVDTQTGKVDSIWTYYEDLTAEEKEDNFWRHWKGDTAWKAQVEAEHASEQ